MPVGIPISSPSSGTTLTTYNDHQTKNITNNASNSLFTFPLASGASATIIIYFATIAKKTTDWSIAGGHLNLIVYNAAGTPQTSTVNDSAFDTKTSAGALGNTNPTPSVTIAASVATFIINPGDLGATPDSYVLDYVVVAPKGNVLTIL